MAPTEKSRKLETEKSSSMTGKNLVSLFFEPEHKESGHWEKVIKDVDRYFFVKGAKPSEVPNAYVVSKEEAEIGNLNP